MFSFTAPACPDRHLKGAEALGADTRNIKRDDAGAFLAGKYSRFLTAFRLCREIF